MCNIFKENSSNITVECNLANFLDVSFNVKSGTCYLYKNRTVRYCR